MRINKTIKVKTKIDEKMCYESPISVERVAHDIACEVGPRTDDVIIESLYDIGINVDKEELNKALNYDRRQYERGWDAAAETYSKIYEPKTGYWHVTNHGDVVCSNCHVVFNCGKNRDFYCGNCGTKMRNGQKDMRASYVCCESK